MEPGKGIALLRNRSSGTIAHNDFSLDSGYETKFLHEYGDITGINSQLWLSVIIILFTLTRSIVITATSYFYHAWLFENGFNVELPNPTNEVVASYYGVKPLWKTDYSQGIVVMAEDESDYFIVMECSSRNRGYKHTKIILTMGGCM